jgi:hypothetical protein
MSDRELTYQQLDPVGSYGSRPITLVFSIGIVILSTIVTAISWPAISDPIAVIFAVVATALSVLGVNYWSSPMRAPFRRSGFVIVLVIAGCGLILYAIATWNNRAAILNEWAPILVGLVLVQLSSYRPARELIAATILGGLLTGFIAVIHPASQHDSMPSLVDVLDAALPVIALGAGATAYSAVLVRSLGRWYAGVPVSERTVSPAMKDRVVRAIHDDRVSILNDTVVPFFTELLVRDSISGEERARAREIAATIRSAMVADVDRSWLDTIMDHLAAERADAPGSEVVQDPSRLASQMTTEQRIVTRAVIVALFDHPGSDPDGFAILIAPDWDRAAVTVTAKLDADDSLTRSGLAPYFAVLRIAFSDLQVSFQAPTLTLRFSYDHK